MKKYLKTISLYYIRQNKGADYEIIRKADREAETL